MWARQWVDPRDARIVRVNAPTDTDPEVYTPAVRITGHAAWDRPGEWSAVNSELEELLILLGERRFRTHEFRADQDGPEILAAVREFRGCTDVVVIIDQDRACAWRMPRGPNTDPFAPTHVHWVYAANPAWTLRALLTLPPPGHPDAPAELIAAPDGIGLPAESRDAVRIRMREQ